MSQQIYVKLAYLLLSTVINELTVLVSLRRKLCYEHAILKTAAVWN